MSSRSPLQTRVIVRLFGAEAAAIGRGEVEVKVEGDRPTVRQLRVALLATSVDLRPFADTMRFAVNHAYADDDAQIRADDEVALIGRVSGG